MGYQRRGHSMYACGNIRHCLAASAACTKCNAVRMVHTLRAAPLSPQRTQHFRATAESNVSMQAAWLHLVSIGAYRIATHHVVRILERPTQAPVAYRSVFPMCVCVHLAILAE